MTQTPSKITVNSGIYGTREYRGRVYKTWFFIAKANHGYGYGVYHLPTKVWFSCVGDSKTLKEAKARVDLVLQVQGIDWSAFDPLRGIDDPDTKKALLHAARGQL